MEIRLNKYLSDAGICSRREADRWIEAGKVRVNGRIAVTGEKINLSDSVRIDGMEIHREERKVLLLFQKPRGIVSSTKNQGQDITVVDYLKYPIRIYPIGRLDKDSEGLLLMTNQGVLVNELMRASKYHEKEYIVTVDKPVNPKFLEQMQKGVPILETVTRPCQVYPVNQNQFRIVLTQGLNRQIRRMCEALGYQVKRLQRVRIMNLTGEDLNVGEYREITKEEWIELAELLGVSKSLLGGFHE
ncbi:MAG: pseudouridine synthase [Blautia sp.]|nr:pseudouridine synthase [Blautia sp.]